MAAGGHLEKSKFVKFNFTLLYKLLLNMFAECFESPGSISAIKFGS